LLQASLALVLDVVRLARVDLERGQMRRAIFGAEQQLAFFGALD
jgi:hypothetical protein